MSDAWDEIQAIKSRTVFLREKLEKRKKERQDILGNPLLPVTSAGSPKPEILDDNKKSTNIFKTETDTDSDFEKILIQILCDTSLVLPINSKQLSDKIQRNTSKTVSSDSLNFYLKKLSAQELISVKDVSMGSETGVEVILVEHDKVSSMFNELNKDSKFNLNETLEESLKRKHEDDSSEELAKISKIQASSSDKKSNLRDSLNPNAADIMSLLSMPSTREKQNKQVGEEILELLSKPTAKERSLAEKFKSQGGAQVMEFCPHGTRIECLRAQQASADIQIEKEIIKEEINEIEDDDDECEIINDIKTEIVISEPENDDNLEIKPEFKTELVVVEELKIIDEPLVKDTCTKLHFKKIIQIHTDESLGDCSFLNTCFHMDTCKYVHYEVDSSHGQSVNTLKVESEKSQMVLAKRTSDPAATLHPPQWIQCDLRFLDMTILGKFAVVMADPPWDIHMELPYGTMSDDEMRQLGVPAMQDDGLIFLWVTGRAMELGRECLKLWGYERVDELIWVKTNQLQRIIRTGRTGHWLNHGKEHCLVGMKGNPPNLNRGLDCDVIVAEVRATSHKPDEIYGIIERLSPGTRKIELFGRPHNVQPNWITLGNQLDGIRLVDPELISSFQKRYPDGNCMAPSSKVT